MQELTFECPTCGNVFKSYRKDGHSVVRCPQCGSMKSKQRRVDAMTPSHIIRREKRAIIIEPRADNILCGYRCVACTKTFELETRPGQTPVCPFCKDTEIVATTPGATFINARGRPVDDKRVIKRLQTIRRSWENVVRFGATINGLIQMAERVGLPTDHVASLRGVCTAALESLEAEHARRLTFFERQKPKRKAS